MSGQYCFFFPLLRTLAVELSYTCVCLCVCVCVWVWVWVCGCVWVFVCVCSTQDNEICACLVLPLVPFGRRDVSMDGDAELVDQYMPTVSVSICCLV
jgi:hypothetical protein